MKTLTFCSSILLIVFLTDCSSDSPDHTNACTAESVNDVPWIKKLKKSITHCDCETLLVQGTYEGETVFYIMISDATCDYINLPTLYSCTGKKLKKFTASEADQQDMEANLTADSILYSCKE